MKYKAEGYITLLVEAVFDYDDAHSIGNQAMEAMRAEAQCRFCLREAEGTLELFDIFPLEKTIDPLSI